MVFVRRGEVRTGGEGMGASLKQRPTRDWTRLLLFQVLSRWSPAPPGQSFSDSLCICPLVVR